MKKSTCSHTKYVQEGYWGYDNEDNRVWIIEDVAYPSTVDLGLHSYKCTLCGEIGYYSAAAQDFYEKGIKCDVKGLDK